MNIQKSFRLLLFTILSIMITAAFYSCKERNEDYPPKDWGTFFYKTKTIAPRPISAILWESNLSVWLGSQNTDGLIYNDGYGWKVFNMQNTEIEHKGITSIVRTPDNILWEANQNGLHYYDGKSWKSLITNKAVKKIITEGVSNLWIAIDSKDTPLAHYQNGLLRFYFVDNLPFESVSDLCIDSSQNIWLATNTGLYAFAEKEFLQINLPEMIKPDFLAASSTSGIWISNGSFNLVNGDFDSMKTVNTGSVSPISRIIALKNGTVWCMTTKGDLLCKVNNTWKFIDAKEQQLPAYQHLAMAEGENGHLLISYENGEVINLKY